MNNAIQDGICQGRVRDAQVPIRNRDLVGDQGCGMSEAVVQHFQEILGILDGNGIAHPFVENEQVGFGQGTQQVCERTVLSGQAKAVEQA